MQQENIRQKLENIISEILIGSNLNFSDFMNILYQTGEKAQLTLGEFDWFYKQIIKILSGEKHRDQLTELLDENFDWPKETLREISSELDDKFFSPLQKYIRDYNSQKKDEMVPQNIPTGKKEVYENFKSSETIRPRENKEDQKSEIEKLKEKIKQLEEKQWQNISSPKEVESMKPENRDQRRFGVAPAKDLGAEDFDWKGDVGGVEIERQEQENTDSEENLDKAQILDEVEHPPRYSPSTSFENRLKNSNTETNFKTKDDPIERSNEESASETGKEISETLSAPEDVEQKRKETYRGGDPYREPIE